MGAPRVVYMICVCFISSCLWLSGVALVMMIPKRRTRTDSSPMLLPSSRQNKIALLFAQAKNKASSENTTATTLNIPSRKRRRQVRQKPKSRHPPHYWSDLSNVRFELGKFWSDLLLLDDDDEKNATQSLSKDQTLLIPNEALLNHFGRNDLRYAIVLYGGRRALARRLMDDDNGGTTRSRVHVVSGKWKQAVEESPELRQLIRIQRYGLSTKVPPLSPGQKKGQQQDASNNNRTEATRRWLHRPGRKPKGYWTLQRTVQELFDYLDQCPSTRGRPSVWMPRPAELGAAGRQDLQLALCRFGGASKIGRMAGLVPYDEWHYFEGQLQLLTELQHYLDVYCDGDRTTFPSASAIQRNGYDELYTLIQQYGGRKCVANRLSLKWYSVSTPRRRSRASDEYAELNWGPFSIDFAVELLQFVRHDQMKRKAPLRTPAISMPSERKLRVNGQDRLHSQIVDFGGYENVARRLGLAFFDL